MIGLICKTNRPSNADTLSNVLSYLTKDDYVSFGLVNKDHMSVMEEHRRRRIRTNRKFLKDFNNSEVEIEYKSNAIVKTRRFGKHIYQKTYNYFGKKNFESKFIKEVVETLDGKNHGFKIDNNPCPTTVSHYKHGVLHGKENTYYFTKGDIYRINQSKTFENGQLKSLILYHIPETSKDRKAEEIFYGENEKVKHIIIYNHDGTVKSQIVY